MAKINLNNDLNGIEIIFEAKPNGATLEGLKACGFRWHNVKKLWYAKQTPERLALAESLTDGQPAPVADLAPVAYNLENLGENSPHLYGAELAAAIREELKKRGVKGVTVRARKITYDTGITLTIKATAADFVSIEEALQRFTYCDFLNAVSRWNGLYTNGRYITESDLYAMTDEEREEARRVYVGECIKKYYEFRFGNNWNNKRADFWELTTAFFEKCRAAYLIANQWNYNNSDSMTDYYDVGYYLDIDVKKSDDFTPREEMTETDRATLEKEREEESRQEAEARAKYEEERKAAEEARAKYDAWEAEAVNEIYNDITIEDLTEAEYITNLAGGIGKEATLDELRETINESGPRSQDAVITRKIYFTSENAFNNFSKLFMYDFDFVAKMGGTATDDIRLTDAETLYKLTPEQRETIKFYNNNCVGVYLNNTLQLVINPEGFTYSRYVYIPTEETETKSAKEETARQAAESETKAAFYIPEPIESQVTAIKPGDVITVYMCDGWLLTNIYAGAGSVEEVTPGEYAQYKGFYITINNGRQRKRVFIRDNNKCLIYRGILPSLPESVTGRQISENMREMYTSDILFTNTYNYYNSCGLVPLLDTCPR